MISLHVKGIRCGLKLLSQFHESRCEISRKCTTLLKEFRSGLPRTKPLAFDVSCHLKLKPLDPHSQVDDCIIARAYGPSKSEFVMNLTDLESTSVFAAKSIEPQDVNKFRVEVEIPVRCDINIVSRLGNVSVESFVADQLTVKAENGDINCRKLNCGEICLTSHCGGVNCEGTLLGNIKISAGKLGGIRGANFQGNLLELETNDGDIVVATSYSDKSTFTTRNGSISLKSLHRESCVSINQGNLSVLGLDGSLDARVQTGNIKVQVTQLKADSYLETGNGDVSLSVAQDNVCQLDLSARNIVILEENMSSSGRIEPSRNGKVFKSFPRSDPVQALMKVVCENGEVHLKEESWISSLNIGRH